MEIPCINKVIVSYLKVLKVTLYTRPGHCTLGGSYVTERAKPLRTLMCELLMAV